MSFYRIVRPTPDLFFCEYSDKRHLHVNEMFEPGTFRLRNERATTELRGLCVERIKVHLVLPVLVLEIYMQHMVDVAN